MRLRDALTTAGLALALSVPIARDVHAQAATPVDSLVEILRARRVTLRMGPDGRLAGDGAEVLLRGGRDAQFVLVGEEHGVAEVPIVTAAIFRELAPLGFRHLAIETGSRQAALLNRSIGQGGDAYAGLLREIWPAPPFYTWKEDAELLGDAVRAAGSRDDVLWGLDYDILADRHALRRLRELAPGAAARAVVDAQLAAADSGLAGALREKNPMRIWMFGGPTDAYPALRGAFAAAANPEADALIEEMAETRAINQLYFDDRGGESNERRALWNKRQLTRYLAAARDADGGLPRVMFKFGANHAMRGRSFVNVHDVGNLASELAEAEGGRSFHVMLAPGAGTRHAVLDPTTMRSTTAPVELQPSLEPFAAAADPAAWTLFDLRTLRGLEHRRPEITAEMRQVIYGFDVLVILSGSHPQAELLPPAP